MIGQVSQLGMDVRRGFGVERNDLETRAKRAGISAESVRQVVTDELVRGGGIQMAVAIVKGWLMDEDFIGVTPAEVHGRRARSLVQLAYAGS